MGELILFKLNEAVPGLHRRHNNVILLTLYQLLRILQQLFIPVQLWRLAQRAFSFGQTFIHHIGLVQTQFQPLAERRTFEIFILQLLARPRFREPKRILVTD